MLSKHWDHPSMYNMIMKLLITQGPNTLIPQEAIQKNPLKFPSSRVSNKQFTFLKKRGVTEFHQELHPLMS